MVSTIKVELSSGFFHIFSTDVLATRHSPIQTAIHGRPTASQAAISI
ncbi:hypothetical protein IKO18_05490 [bacterium]|nr:hypothetical protein [bacterium]